MFYCYIIIICIIREEPFAFTPGEIVEFARFAGYSPGEIGEIAYSFLKA
jgi:hypothetical protein